MSVRLGVDSRGEAVKASRRVPMLSGWERGTIPERLGEGAFPRQSRSPSLAALPSENRASNACSWDNCSCLGNVKGARYAP